MRVCDFDVSGRETDVSTNFLTFHNLASERKWMAKQSVCQHDVSAFECPSDFGGTDGNFIQYLRRDFNHLETKRFFKFFQKYNISLTACAKAMVVADDNESWGKFFKQKIFDVLKGSLLSKFQGEGHYHHMVNASLGE